MKTIKQIADALGVSKTAIRKYMTADFREKYVQTTENGVIAISEDGANLLQTIFKKPQTTENKFAETAKNSISNDIIKHLMSQLEEKDKQLSAKDAQIATLTVALENMTASLNAAQALHAADKQQQLLLTENKKRGIFRLFRKKHKQNF